MDWWNVLKARGEPKRRKQDQRDLEEFAERRDRHFDDSKVDARSMVKVRAPRAFAGVNPRNIKFTDPDETKEVVPISRGKFNPYRNKNINRVIRDQKRDDKEKKRDRNLQSHFAGSGIKGAKKFMGDGEVKVHIPIARQKRPNVPIESEKTQFRIPLGAGSMRVSKPRGLYDEPSEAFEQENIKQLLLEGFKPSPAQRAQMPEGQQTRQGVMAADEAKRRRDEEYERQQREMYERLFG